MPCRAQHFLDLDQVDPKTFARSSIAQGDEKRAPTAATTGRWRQDPPHDLREALDPHPRVVRGRHARARRQTIMLGRTDTQLGRGETIADTARVLSRSSTSS